MPDPHLFNIMHGIPESQKQIKTPLDNHLDNNIEKDRFQLSFEETIKEYVKTIMMGDDPAIYTLTPPEIRRAQLEREALEAADLSDYGLLLTSAVHILENEGSQSNSRCILL